ncbi:MAG TPA: PQQ-dependent dehydrogenase, methanol/ethanol family [Steroidobacteraceae bacterium]|nr:PQQ-dependent dehydrogenase, methanol/ethanol family [Steroidobacteraceae bacterium]
MKSTRLTGLMILPGCLLASLGAAAAAPTGGDWPLNGRTFEAQHHSPLPQINATNVQRLGLAWEFRDFVVRGRTHRAMQSSPLVVDGIMYFSGPWGVAYALDARTGRHLWTYDPKPDGQYARSACCDVMSRGLAVWHGRVYAASLDGYLTALDARSGQVLWRVDTFVDHHWNYTITGAPYIAGDNVLIGNAGAEMGARGYASAYNLQTGRLAWRFWSIPGDPAKGPDETPDVTLARHTWAKDSHWELGGGGTVWDSMAYDPEAKLVYLGIGNGDPHPRWLRSPGGGDNLFICSIVAVDATTGRLKWYYQESPGDSWDFDATTPMVLADLDLKGRTRPVLMQASKNGIFYVIDRLTGELLRADAYTYVNWTDGIDLKTGRPHITTHADYSRGPRIIWPSPAGGHGWQPISFDPDTHLVYVPVYEAPMRFHADPTAKFQPGYWNQAEGGEFPPYTDAAAIQELRHQPAPSMQSHLQAWDPVQGRAVWASGPLPFGVGGTLSTAGGVVFEGTSDGFLSAYDARSGRRLAHIATGTAISAAPISYQIDAVQYVAVMAGAGGPQGARFGPDVAASHYQNFERLLVLRLDGGPVPLPPPVVVPARQPTPPPLAADAAALSRGAQLFHDYCVRCHVVGGAFGEFPDLWNLPTGTLAAFDPIVRGGALRDAGMGAFDDVLSAADVAAIRAYIVNDERRRRADRPTAPPR